MQFLLVEDGDRLRDVRNASGGGPCVTFLIPTTPLGAATPQRSTQLSLSTTHETRRATSGPGRTFHSCQTSCHIGQSSVRNVQCSWSPAKSRKIPCTLYKLSRGVSAERLARQFRQTIRYVERWAQLEGHRHGRGNACDRRQASLSSRLACRCWLRLLAMDLRAWSVRNDWHTW
jgi:hypothetical protein